MVYPGKVPLHKVNWKAKFEYEFVYNFKILQQSFTRCNVTKVINVNIAILLPFVSMRPGGEARESQISR